MTRDYPVSIMEPMRKRRTISEPPVHRQNAQKAPDPWATFGPLGATRTATALAELSTLTQGLAYLWPAQEQIAAAVNHEMLELKQNTWRDGIRHGKWLAAQEVENYDRDVQKLAETQEKLWNAELNYAILKAQYDDLLEDCAKDLSI